MDAEFCWRPQHALAVPQRVKPPVNPRVKALNHRHFRHIPSLYGTLFERFPYHVGESDMEPFAIWIQELNLRPMELKDEMEILAA